jgi:hypothetical protein
LCEQVFDFHSKEQSKFGCGAPLAGVDLYRPSDNHFRDVAYVNNVSSIGDCCAQCAANVGCNGYSLMKAEHECILKSCDLGSEAACAAAGTPGSTDRTSGFLAPFRTASVTVNAAAIVTSPNISGWGLEAFSLIITDAPPKTKGVLARGRDFTIRGVAIELRQHNATSAVKVEGATRFEIADCWMEQSHLCFWGPKLGLSLSLSL